MRLRPWLALALPVLLLACGDGGEDLGTAEEAIKVCPGPKTLEGIDVSHWDGTVDWAQVKASGRSFAIAKATEGTTYKDPQFAANWAGMKQHGVVRGAYHFFHSNADPIVEADHFLQVMGPLEPGDLPPTLDLEVTDGQSKAVITDTAIQWLDHVAAMTGTKPILYTSPAFVTGSMGSPAGLETHALLWIANWGVTCPDVPAPFTSWGFWQYDDMGSVPSITGNCDLNVFDGTEADLTALTVQPATTSSASSSSSSSSSSSTSSSSGGGGAGGAPSTSSSSAGNGGGKTTSASSGSGGITVHASAGCSCSTPASDDLADWRGWACLAALGVALRRRRRTGILGQPR
jgi:lysozyme